MLSETLSGLPTSPSHEEASINGSISDDEFVHRIKDIEGEMEDIRKENKNHNDNFLNLRKEIKTLREYNDYYKSQRDTFVEKLQGLESLVQHQLKMNQHFISFRESAQKEMNDLRKENDILKSKLISTIQELREHDHEYEIEIEKTDIDGYKGIMDESGLIDNKERNDRVRLSSDSEKQLVVADLDESEWEGLWMIPIQIIRLLMEGK